MFDRQASFTNFIFKYFLSIFPVNNIFELSHVDKMNVSLIYMYIEYKLYVTAHLHFSISLSGENLCFVSYFRYRILTSSVNLFSMLIVFINTKKDRNSSVCVTLCFVI